MSVTSVAETLATVIKRLEKLEAAVGKSKSKPKKKTESDSETEKPKKTSPWFDFVKRVRALLKEHDMAFSIPTEVTQFCSALKAMRGNYDLWWNDEILEQRREWVKPEKSKQELAGKNSKKSSAASSVTSAKKAKALPASDDEGSEEEESEAEPEPEVKKKPGRPKKVLEVEEKKEAPKKVEEKKPVEVKKPVEAPKKPAGRPKKKVVEEDENYTGNIEAFKHKGMTYAKTDRHDVIDEDDCEYVGRWNEETNEIDHSFPEPAYVKKLIAGMNSDDE